MPSPQDPRKYSPELLAAAEIRMATVLEEWPDLGYSGFGVVNIRHKDAADRAAELAAERRHLREPSALAAFIAARAWLARQPRRKTLNKMDTSYSLKHIAEREIGYLSNGVLIAAAIAERFAVGRVLDHGMPTPNAYLNIATRAWAATHP